MIRQKLVGVVGIALSMLCVEASETPKAEKQSIQKIVKKDQYQKVWEKVWEKVYGEKKDDIAVDIVALEEGESAIVGTCKSFGAKRSDVCVSRLDEKGHIKWTILLGGEKVDEGRAITRAADGSLFVLGMTKSLASNSDKDIYVAKVTLEGKLLWEKAIGGDRDETPGGIAGLDDGSVMIVGDTESFTRTYKEIYIAKLNKEGKLLFARTIGGKKTDEAHDLTRLSDGNLALVGMREVQNNYEEFFVMKLDQNGKQIWTKTFGGPDDDSLESVTATADGGLIAVGKTRSYGSQQTDLTVMKLSASGKVLWQQLYGFKYYEYANAVTTTKKGGCVVAGGTNTLGKGSHSVYMLALSKNGKLLWSHVYGGKSKDVAYGIARMSDGSIISVGESDSFSRSKNFHIIKIKAE